MPDEVKGGRGPIGRFFLGDDKPAVTSTPSTTKADDAPPARRFDGPASVSKDGVDKDTKKVEAPKPPPPPPRLLGDLKQDAPIAQTTAAKAAGFVAPTNPRIFPGAKVIADGKEQTLVGYTTSGRFIVKDGAGKENTVSDVMPKAGQQFQSIGQTLPASHVHKVGGAQKAALDALLAREMGSSWGGKKGTVGAAIDAIRAGGFEALIAGGAVRDVVAGGQPRDVDIATTMWAREVERALDRANVPSGRTNSSFGTLLIGSGESGLDITSLKRGRGEFGLDLAEDIKHRDFTVNALYYDPASSVILDPTGHGVEDAKKKHIRPTFPKGQEQAWLRENPSVVLRFLKFTLKGYTYDPSLLKFIKDNFASSVKSLDSFRRSRMLDSVASGGNQKETIIAEMKRLEFPQSDIDALFPAPTFFGRRRGSDDDDDSGFGFSWSSGGSSGGGGRSWRDDDSGPGFRSSGPRTIPGGSSSSGPSSSGPSSSGPSSSRPSSAPPAGRYMGPSFRAVQEYAQATKRTVVDVEDDPRFFRTEAIQIGVLSSNTDDNFAPRFSRGFRRSNQPHPGELYTHRDGSWLHWVQGNLFRGVDDKVFASVRSAVQSPAPSQSAGPVSIPVQSGPTALDKWAGDNKLKIGRANVSDHGHLAIALGNLGRVSMFEGGAADDLKKAGFVQLDKGHWEHNDGSWVRFDASLNNVYRGFKDQVFANTVAGPGPQAAGTGGAP